MNPLTAIQSDQLAFIERLVSTLEMCFNYLLMLDEMEHEEWGRRTMERVRDALDLARARRGDYRSLTWWNKSKGYQWKAPAGYHQWLPWTFDGWQIVDGERCPVANVGGFKEFQFNQKANGALLVNAANSHHALVTGCANALNWLIDDEKDAKKRAQNILNGALSSVLEIPESYFYEEKTQMTFNDFLVKNKQKKVSEFACRDLEDAA